jgi:hypothetical protein
MTILENLRVEKEAHLLDFVSRTNHDDRRLFVLRGKRARRATRRPALGARA